MQLQCVGVKLYRKVTIELFTNTAAVNARALYKAVARKNVQITEFCERLAKCLIYRRQEFSHVTQITPRKSTERKHELKETGRKRGRCGVCYTSLVEQFGGQDTLK